MSWLRPTRPLRAAVLYTPDKALGGSAKDDQLIVRAFEQRGQAESVNLANLRRSEDGRFWLSDPETGIARQWQAPDVVLMYHGAISPPNTAPMLDALQGAGSFVINDRSAWTTMTDKAIFAKVMKAARVPTIPTVEVRTEAQAIKAFRSLKAKTGGPVVFKKPISTEGDDVYIVRSERQLRREVTQRLDTLGGRMIAQPFVKSAIGRGELEPAIVRKIEQAVANMPAKERRKLPPNFPRGMNNDFRVMTVRDPNGTVSVIGVFHRIATSADQPVNNVAKGSIAVRMEFDDLHPADRATLLEAVEALPSGQIVGWDLIGNPGKRVIMEANSGPGLPTMSDGFDPDALLVPYADLAFGAAMRARAARDQARRGAVLSGGVGAAVGLPVGYGVGSLLDG